MTKKEVFYIQIIVLTILSLIVATPISIAQKTVMLPIYNDVIVFDDSIDFSKYTIQGIIVEESTNLPLIGTSILLENTSQGTTTDIDGFFSLEIDKEQIGSNLTFSHVGYIEQQIELTPYEIDNINYIQMQGHHIDLATIEVVATKSMANKCELWCGLTVSPESSIDWKRSRLPKFNFQNNLSTAVFPNPFHTFINVQLNLETTGAYLLQLYDVQGKLLFTEVRELSIGKQVIALENLPHYLSNGAYLLQISDKNGQNIITQQIVKSTGY